VESSERATLEINDSDHFSMMNFCGEQTHVRRF